MRFTHLMQLWRQNWILQIQYGCVNQLKPPVFSFSKNALSAQICSQSWAEAKYSAVSWKSAVCWQIWMITKRIHHDRTGAVKVDCSSRRLCFVCLTRWKEDKGSALISYASAETLFVQLFFIFLYMISTTWRLIILFMMLIEINYIHSFIHSFKSVFFNQPMSRLVCMLLRSCHLEKLW